jgi:tRNA-2-methylthio-N6-dimethylallyladenosine synthase
VFVPAGDLAMSKKYLIETFGCQMNVHDSERMAGLLEQAGYKIASRESEADVIVVNTCSVREHAEVKLYTRLGELRVMAEETGRRPTVVVAGCVAQQEGAALRQRTNGHLIDVIVGTQQIRALPALVDRASRSALAEIEIGSAADATFPLGVTRRGLSVRASITIIEGCNDHCAFCVVPTTRGHERMRLKDDILAEARDALRSGHQELLLLGQIVNHYQAPDDPNCDFACLLEAVAGLPGLQRLRFASPHPRHTSSTLIAAIRDLPRVCKQLHLPLQSGSTRILTAMRRRHTREEYLRLVDRVRAAVPNIALSTDLIVGFPGESRADFEETLSLVRQVQFQAVYSFKYSPRPNTLAAKRMLDDVTDAEKTDRIVELQSVQRDIQLARHQALVGTTTEVLVESVSRRRAWELSGRTDGNMVVNFSLPADTGDRGPSQWVGRTVPVIITRGGPNSVAGMVVAQRQLSS